MCIYIYNVLDHTVLVYIYYIVAGAVLINNVVRDTHTPFGGGRWLGGWVVQYRYAAAVASGVGIIARVGLRAYHMVARNL